MTKKQAEIIRLMAKGEMLICGNSDFTGRAYFSVTNGGKQYYFRSDTFSRLLNNGFIHQQLSHPFEFILTRVALQWYNKHNTTQNERTILRLRNK